MRRLRARAALPVYAGSVAAVLMCLYLAGAGPVGWQAVSCWLAVAAFATTMTWYAFRAGRRMDRNDPERRFWAAFAAAGVIFTAGDWIQVATVAADPLAPAAMTGTGLDRTVALLLGGGLLTAVLLTCPLPRRTGRERVGYLLDLATVVTAAGAFGAFWAAPAGPVVAMLIAFVLGRLYLSGAAPFRRHIGVIGPVAVAAEATARALGPELARAGRPGLVFALSVGSHAMLAIAAWLQHRLSGRRRRRVASKPPYSLLPYVAIGATNLLLIVTLVLNGLDLRAWLILAGAVGSTGMVVARQIAAFVDNALLLRQRDTLTARLHRMAFTDNLTGLGNRALFLDELAATLTPGAGVLLIDLDDFKPVNDRHGHGAGDDVLVETAARLRAALRPGDVIARLGGDEFAVLIPAPPDDGFPALAARIVHAIDEPYVLSQYRRAWVRASVGVAIARPDDTPSTLLNRADQAMYQAKAAGKGAYQLATA